MRRIASHHIIDRAEGQKVIDTAMECGVNYFDMSHTYQNKGSEQFMGEALAKYPRDRYFLASKFYAKYSSDISAMFEEQLRRCKTDYFDFHLFHGIDENFVDAYMDKEKGYLAFLLEQKDKGRIRNMGFSSHTVPETLARFLDWYDQFDKALIQANYVDWTVLDAKLQYEILTEHHIPVWVMEPLKGGRLSSLSPDAAEILQAANPQRSISSWGIRYLMKLDNVQVILSGLSSVAQVLDNANTFSKRDPLSHEEEQILERAAQVFQSPLGVPCSACRYCCSACPAELDIPHIMCQLAREVQ